MPPLPAAAAMSAAELVATGLLMGAIHVLTGPDHLSALATLCGTNLRGNADADGHRKRESFLLGIRWGIGHSVGLLVVGGLLIAVEETGEWIAMDSRLKALLEGFVGAFMLALGAYGLFRAEKNHRESAVAHGRFRRRHSTSMVSLKSADPVETQMIETGKSLRQVLEGLDDSDIASRMEEVLDTDSKSCDLSHALSMDDVSFDPYHEYIGDVPYRGSTGSPSHSVVTVPFAQSSKASSVKPGQPSKPTESPRAQANLMAASSLVTKHTEKSVVDIAGWANGPLRDEERCCGLRRFFLFTPGLLALAAGVLHGVAGPAGVLGVIPAVQLRDAKLAITYLGTFCVSSTLVMGGFAASYGRLSEWLAGGSRGQAGNRVYMVEVGSALLSLSVGAIWLVLLGLGKLDEVFP